MDHVVNAKTLRSNLAEILERASTGERFVVVYRSRPLCRIAPLDTEEMATGAATEDSLYRAGAVGSSRDGRTAADHDEFLYGRSSR
jgi:prevent-host-death family protein